MVRAHHSGRPDPRRGAPRRNEKSAGPRPQPFIFKFQPDNETFRLRIQFRKSNVSREELASTLRAILRDIESGNISSPPPPELTQQARQAQ